MIPPKSFYFNLSSLRVPFVQQKLIRNPFTFKIGIMKKSIFVFAILAFTLFIPMAYGQAPTITSINLPDVVGLQGGEMNNTFQANCTYHDVNGTSNIDRTSSYLEIAEDDGFGDRIIESRKYFDNANISEINSTTEKATVLLDDVPYYKPPQEEVVTCYVQDDQSNSDKDTNTTTIPELVSTEVNVSSLDFGAGTPDTTLLSPTFQVKNYGNVRINSSWNATDLGPIGVDNITLSQKDILMTNFVDSNTAFSNCFYSEYKCYNDEPFQNFYADGLQIKFRGYCSEDKGYVNFVVNTSKGEVVLSNQAVYGTSADVYWTNATNLDAMYYGYDINSNCTDLNIENTQVNGRTSNMWNIEAHFNRSMGMSKDKQTFVSNLNRMERGVNHFGNKWFKEFPDTHSEYKPKFELYIPPETPLGNYTNTFTHTVTGA